MHTYTHIVAFLMDPVPNRRGNINSHGELALRLHLCITRARDELSVTYDQLDYSHLLPQVSRNLASMEHQGQPGHATAHVDEYATARAPGGGEQMQPMKEDHKTDGVLRRSGSSSSSSSSEDDGMGGRRKKGIKEKIKEKLPGSNKDNQHQATATGGTHTGVTGTGAHGTTADGTGEKKGVVEKIKEKLPGKH